MLLTQILASAMLAAPQLAHTVPGCELPGSLIQWQADYCLFVSETDDLVAAQSCIDEQPRDFADECSGKRHYKRLRCELIVAAGYRSGTTEACIRDVDAVGSVVKRDGL